MNSTEQPGPLEVRSSDLLGLAAMRPACWTLTATLDQAETTNRAFVWFSDPRNTAWEPLYRRAALDRVLAHSREVHQFNEELHAKNTALSCEVLDLRLALGDLLTAHQMRASCQAGMVERCKCVPCATTRARVALGA